MKEDPEEVFTIKNKSLEALAFRIASRIQEEASKIQSQEEASSLLSDPAHPLEASSVSEVWKIVSSNEDYLIQASILRQRLQEGEDVSKDLIALGYLIAHYEGRTNPNEQSN